MASPYIGPIKRIDTASSASHDLTIRDKLPRSGTLQRLDVPVNNQCSICSRTPANIEIAPDLQARRINEIQDLPDSVNRRVGEGEFMISGGTVNRRRKLRPESL
jgi:hypothetical protein